MLRFIVAYVITAVAFCALDFVWLGLVAPKFYQAQLGNLLLETPHWLPAVTFYLIYVAGLVVVGVIPGLDAASSTRAALLGAILGLVAYSTYDLSNLATLRGWTLGVSIVDMAWGTVASVLASLSGYFGTHYVLRSMSVSY